MFCCGGGRKKIELEEDDNRIAIPSPIMRRKELEPLHDYIFSPKDFCDSVLRKKLVPEYYLDGIDLSAISNATRDGQDVGRNGVRASQGIRKSSSRSNMRTSQNGLRKSRSSQGVNQSVLYGSQGDNLENASLTLSQGGGGDDDESISTQPSADRVVLVDEDALRASLGDTATNEIQKSNSFESSTSDGSNPPLSRSQSFESSTSRRESARYSSFFSNMSYTNINYYDEFCALFPHFAIVPTDGFRVEVGGRVAMSQELFLQEQDAYNLAYARIFQKNDHHNFVGGDYTNPFIISILGCDDVEGGCRTIVRTKFRDHHVIIPSQSSPLKMARYALALVRKIEPNGLPAPKQKFPIQQIPGTFIVKDLTSFEDKAYKSKLKMGILYSRAGQTTEEEMFANVDPSAEFIEFLDMIGERVRLQNLPPTQFNGGLDTKSNLSGTESYCTIFEGIEMMFHVSTLLPFAPDRPVQVERKKHIGNDVVCIIFMDSATPFKPNTITSKFIHVIIVVQFLERNSANQPVYRVSVASKLGVESHQPILPTPPHFEGNEYFRNFLLTKAINAERAAIHAPAFKLTRTRMNGLATIVEKHVEEAPKKCFG